jgi:glutathione S-transferase
MGVARVFHATHAVLPGRVPDAALAERFRGDLDKPARFFDTLLADARAFVAGDRVTIADCTLLAAMEFARTGNLGIEWPAQIARWYERFRERPSASA